LSLFKKIAAWPVSVKEHCAGSVLQPHVLSPTTNYEPVISVSRPVLLGVGAKCNFVLLNVIKTYIKWKAKLLSFLSEVLSTLLSSVVWRIPGCDTQRQDNARSLTWHGSFNLVPDLRRESALNMTYMVSNPKELSSQCHSPHLRAYCLVSNGPHLFQIEVFNRDENSLALTQSQLQFKVSVTEPSDAVNAVMTKQTEGVRLAIKSVN
jgi:hypothetical protein